MSDNWLNRNKRHVPKNIFERGIKFDFIKSLFLEHAQVKDTFQTGAFCYFYIFSFSHTSVPLSMIKPLLIYITHNPYLALLPAENGEVFQGR